VLVDQLGLPTLPGTAWYNSPAGMWGQMVCMRLISEKVRPLCCKEQACCCKRETELLPHIVHYTAQNCCCSAADQLPPLQLLLPSCPSC
jgi:hypothetical protein